MIQILIIYILIDFNTYIDILTGYPIHYMQSDVHAYVKLNALSPVQRVSLPGERKRPACPFTYPGCPFTSDQNIVISKEITVPKQARLVSRQFINLCFTFLSLRI